MIATAPDNKPPDDRPAVLQVLHTMRRGGAETLALDLVRALGHRFRFIVAALDEAGPIRDDLESLGVPAEVVRRRPGFDLSCAARLARLAHAHAVDVIHAHQYSPYVYAALAKGRLGGRPGLVFTEHGRHQPDRPRLRRVLANRLLLLRRTDRITAVADAVRRALVANEMIPAERIEVIRNGVPLDRFRVPDRNAVRARIRAGMRVDASTPLILQVAGFRPVKDHGVALDALAGLRRRGCNAVLALAGGGPLEPRIRELAALLGVHDAVRFLGVRDDVPELWCAADVGLLTSRSEGLSVAAIEAMASGVPMVATRVGGNPEVICHDETGYLAPVADGGSIAAALWGLLMNDAIRKRMAALARRRAEQHFDQAKMHAAFGRIYENLASRAAAHAGAPTDAWNADRHPETSRAA